MGVSIEKLFTQEEFRRLLFLIFLGEWVVNAQRGARTVPGTAGTGWTWKKVSECMSDGKSRQAGIKRWALSRHYERE